MSSRLFLLKDNFLFVYDVEKVGYIINPGKTALNDEGLSIFV